MAFDRTLCFTLSPANATLFNERHQRGLASAIEQVLEEPVTVQIALGKPRIKRLRINANCWSSNGSQLRARRSSLMIVSTRC